MLQRGKTIKEIVSTVKKYLTENDEIIVIDDCSSDNTLSILKNDLKKLLIG